MRPRLSVVSFEASSNVLKGKALKRVKLVKTVKPAIFNIVVINTRFKS